MAPTKQTAYQPFRGASLIEEMSAAIRPYIEELGAARLLRAMTLQWLQTDTVEQARLLALVNRADDAEQALRALDPSPKPTAAEVKAAERALAAAKVTAPPKELALTETERAILERRLLAPGNPSLDDVGHELGGISRQYVQKQEASGKDKLARWVLTLLAQGSSAHR